MDDIDIDTSQLINRDTGRVQQQQQQQPFLMNPVENPVKESANLLKHADPCGQYQALEGGEPILDQQAGDELQQHRPKHGRGRRARCISQGSRRSANITGYTGRVSKKTRRRQLCGIAAPPRHVHCNDWREMLEITKHMDRRTQENTQQLQQQPQHTRRPQRKSEADIGQTQRFNDGGGTTMRDGGTNELRAVENETHDGICPPKQQFPSAPSLHQLVSAIRDPYNNRRRNMSGSGSSMPCDWIEQTFCKRECIQFIPSSRDANKCGCGRYENQHLDLEHYRPFIGDQQQNETNAHAKRWSIQKHTTLAPTDAYGTIEFQGGPHPTKAQYLRLSFDSDPADIMCLFENVWQMEPPKLIITIHGGITNFELQPKLARVFRKGLLKAARTTGAWIFTSGINAGVVRQVAAALESTAIPTSKLHKIVCVGIAPWGVLKRREDLVREGPGRDKVVQYHPQSFSPKTRFAVLHPRHSFFLLVDNGTVGRGGADIILRRRLESYIAEKQKIGGGNRSVPVVCVVLEGGTCTIRTVLDYVTTIPKVPVVICDGSGRASDLLAFAHQFVQEDGNLPEVIRPQLLSLIEDVFYNDRPRDSVQNARSLFLDILACMRQKNLITVFRLGESQKQDVDHAILTALLKGHNLSPAEQLSLALAWNRVDIARSDIFVMGQDWPKHALHNAMMEALIHNRVDFVRLLLENGVSMHEFLTIARLEELYNTDQGPPNTLYYIVRDVVKIRAGYRYKLPHIGMAVEKLMANGFRSHYTSSEFRQKYSDYKNRLKLHLERHRLQCTHNQLQQQQQHPESKMGAPNSYHRCGSEFFAARGLPHRPMASSASDTRLTAGHLTMRPQHLHQQHHHQETTFGGAHVNTARFNNITLSQPSHHHHHASNSTGVLSPPVPTISGNRALSNHILWRTAYRRENPAAKKMSTLLGGGGGGADNVAKSPTAFPSYFAEASQFGDPTEEIGYAHEADESLNIDDEHMGNDFRYPFSDLLVWAVLTKRHEMALCMWQHGEEAMAKALVACRLYKSLAKEAAEDYLEVEVCEELKKYAEEFRQLSLDLLDHCYKQDDAQTLQLLTYELSYWGKETCLSLAVIVNNKQFLAHPCCQILLADLWHGGLRIRSNSNLKVILGILFPPSIFLLEFKSREELMLQPQTAAEHQDDINDTSSSSSGSSSSSSSSDSEPPSETEVEMEGAEKGPGAIGAGDRRRTSHGSMQSLNFTSIFHSKRKRHRSSNLNASAAAAATTGGADLESGKAKYRDGHRHSIKESRSRTKSSRSNANARVDGALAKAAQQSLGTAVSVATAVNVNRSSPLLTVKTHSPLSPRNSSPAKLHHKITPLQVDASSQQQQRQKSPPNFTLGSIGEKAGTAEEHDGDGDGEDEEEDEEEGSISIMSSPNTNGKVPLPPRTAGNAFGEHYPSSTPISPQLLRQQDQAVPHLQMPTSPTPPPSLLGDVYSQNVGDKFDVTKATMDHLHCMTANGSHVPKGIPLPEGVTLNKKRQIKFRRKLYEFFVAPITTFWSWTLSFLVFLCILTYVLLVRTPPKPTFLEWYLLAYVLAFGVEIIRKFWMSEPKKIKEKFEYFFGNYWNFLTAVAIAAFIIGFIFRLNPSTSRTVGRIILAVDSVLWTVKLLDFLGVFPQFGPYITMAGKMIMNMSSIIVMLGISLLGFGLARQSITYPEEEWHWLLLRNVFYKPYFMLYGEVYADEIDICGDDAWDEHLEKNMSIAAAWSQDRDRALACVSGHWIPPILMTVFLIIANILLINMLIAIFNNIFETTNKISQQIWLFQRYRQVMEYEATPFLPPPFTPIYHAYMMAKYMNYYCQASRRNRNCSCLSLCRLCLCCFWSCMRRGKGGRGGGGVGTEDEDGGTVDGGDRPPSANNNNKEKGGGAPQLPKNAFDQRRHLQTGRSQTQERLVLFDFSLKLFLSDDQVEKLHDFEEECMEDLAREKEYQRNRTSEERLHRTCERTELILLRVNDLSSKETMLKGNVRELETRVEMMESKQSEMLDYLRQLSATMPALVQSLQFLQQQQQQTGQFPPPIVSHFSTAGSGQSDAVSVGRKASATSSGRIIPARSEGHIFGDPNRTQQPVVDGSQAKSVGNIAQKQRVPSSPQPMLPSVNVDATAATPTTLLPPEAREQRAHSYGNTGASSVSSLSTNYCAASGTTGTNDMTTATKATTYFTPKTRIRTSTIGGAEMPSHATCTPPLLTTDADSPQQHRHLFGGSLVSLTPAIPTDGAVLQRRNTQRWHHDEYTSITDTINVEELELKSRGSAAPTASQPQVGGTGKEAIDSTEEKEEDEEDPHPNKRSEVDEEVQTEEELDEEEEDLEEEEEAQDDELEDELDEEDDSSSLEKGLEVAKSRDAQTETARRRRPQRKVPVEGGDSVSLQSFEADEHLRRAAETIASRGYTVDGNRFGEALGGFDDSADFRPRLPTPNSTLRQARSSFVRKQNEHFKGYEEDVGGPSSPLRQRRTKMKGKSADGTAAESAAAAGSSTAKKKQSTRPARNESQSSKEFISFTAPTNQQTKTEDAEHSADESTSRY